MCKLLHSARFYTHQGLFSLLQDCSDTEHTHTHTHTHRSITQEIPNLLFCKHTHMHTQLNMLCNLSIELIIAQGGLYKLRAAFISIISYPSSFPHTFFRGSFGLVCLTHTHIHTYTYTLSRTVGNPLLSFRDSFYNLAYELLLC